MKTLLFATQLLLCALLAVCSGAMIYNSIRWNTSPVHTVFCAIFFVTSCYLTYHSYKELKKGDVI